MYTCVLPECSKKTLLVLKYLQVLFIKAIEIRSHMRSLLTPIPPDVVLVYLKGPSHQISDFMIFHEIESVLYEGPFIV
jgi:hypothetical protein